jgi:hypothetical protein
MDTDVIDDSEIVVEKKEDVTYDAHNKTVKKIFYNVPSPLEVSSMLKKAGVDYNADFLNSYKKVSSYTTVEEMALNLGIYGADLSYNRLYDQIQESVNYFSAIKKLSDDLGIPQSQGGNAAERMESNLENRDSLLNIISQTYSEADHYLKQNDRGSTASLIILGGWVEALYIATQIASLPNDNEQLMNNIAEQKLSLENLIGLMSGYQDDEIVAKHIDNLQRLKKAFDKVEINQTANEVTTDKEKSLTTIHSETEIIMSAEDFVEIMTIVSEIRNQII